MGTHYYYFAASLPSLSPEADMVMSPLDFRNECARHLKPRDLLILQSARIDDFVSPALHPVFGRWRDFETDLRNQFVILRAGSLGWNPSEHVRMKFEEAIFVGEVAREIFRAENPLKAEEALYAHRWKFLTSLEEGHFMDLENLTVYHLKLQLIEQHQLISRDRGHRTREHVRLEVRNRLSDMAPVNHD